MHLIKVDIRDYRLKVMNRHFIALLDDYHLLNSHYRELQIQHQDLKRDYEKLMNRFICRKTLITESCANLERLDKGLSGLYSQIRFQIKPMDPICLTAQKLNEVPLGPSIRFMRYLESLATIYE